MPTNDPEPTGTDIVKIDVAGEMVTLSDPANAQMAIMERILSAPTLEAVFEVAGTQGADDVDRKPFFLKNVEFFKSDYVEGPGAYAIIHCVFEDTGEAGVITCGGSNVVAQLIAASKFGAPPTFPIQLARNLKPTAKGFYPLWLEAAPNAA